MIHTVIKPCNQVYGELNSLFLHVMWPCYIQLVGRVRCWRIFPPKTTNFVILHNWDDNKWDNWEMLLRLWISSCSKGLQSTAILRSIIFLIELLSPCSFPSSRDLMKSKIWNRADSSLLARSTLFFCYHTYTLPHFFSMH